jgi:hypothetical protein
MLGRLKHDEGQFFYSYCLDGAVADDHPLRENAAVLDNSWVHSELALSYPQAHPTLDRSRTDDPDADRRLHVRDSLGTSFSRSCPA